MCIICLKKQSASIKMSEIELMWKTNPDGAGYAFNYEGKIIMRKGFMKCSKLIKSITNDNKQYGLKDKTLLIHCRLATHGAVNRSNTHPFAVNDDCVFAHNGVISSLLTSIKDNILSDTALFCALVKILPKNWYKSKGIMKIVERYIKPGKLCFLMSDGSYHITNESVGTWDDSRWFSNTHWRNILAARPVNYGCYNLYSSKDRDGNKEIFNRCNICQKWVNYNDRIYINGKLYCKACESRTCENFGQLPVKIEKIECPVCRNKTDMYDGFPTIWCDLCSISFNAKGELLYY